MPVFFDTRLLALVTPSARLHENDKPGPSFTQPPETTQPSSLTTPANTTIGSTRAPTQTPAPTFRADDY